MTQVIVILESKPRGGEGGACTPGLLLAFYRVHHDHADNKAEPTMKHGTTARTYVRTNCLSGVLTNMGYISVISFGLPWTEIDNRPRSRRKLDDAKRVVWRTYGPFHLSETLGQIGCHCQWIDDQQSLLYVYF